MWSRDCEALRNLSRTAEAIAGEGCVVDDYKQSFLIKLKSSKKEQSISTALRALKQSMYYETGTLKCPSERAETATDEPAFPE